MPNSCTAPADIPCAACGAPIRIDAWILIDVDERPDLIAALREGRLNRASCPNCGAELVADLPALLYFPGVASPLLFSPAATTSEEQNRRHAAMSEGLARRHLAGAWREGWVRNGLLALRRDDVKTFLARGASGDLHAELRRLRVERALLALIAADSPEEGRAVVEANPELLAPLAEETLLGWARDYRSEGRPELAGIALDYRAILGRCREIGTEAAFREHGAAGDPQRTPEGDRLFHKFTELAGQPVSGARELAEAAELCRRILGEIDPTRDAFLRANVSGHLGEWLLQAGADRAEAMEALASALTEPQLLGRAPPLYARYAVAYSEASEGPAEPKRQAVIEGLRRALDAIEPDAHPAEREACRDALARLYALDIEGL